MAASRDESKVVTPFMPSLLHCAAVKIAIRLFEEFGVETMAEALTEIQNGNSTPSEGSSTKNCRAKEILLEIPADLRRRVMEAVYGSDREFQGWSWHHSKFKVEKRNIHWRSDGSLDGIRTARDLVQNAKFDIGDRFELACNHFFEESVQALWAEMEASGETESHRTWPEGVVSFWVQWLREQPRAPLKESLVTWMPRLIRILDVPLKDPPDLFPRCSALLPLLPPEDREKSFPLLCGGALFDDVRFFLYGLTKHEEERFIKKEGDLAYVLLCLHLRWPLQTLFLETAGKLWNFIDERYFSNLLHYIFDLIEDRKDFNYSDLFERFWNASPLHLREDATKCRQLRQLVDRHFEKKGRKRKSVKNEQSEEM